MKSGILIGILLIVIGGIILTSFPPENTESELECVDDTGRCYKTIVSKVVDGDTIKTTDDQSIRLALAAAPELSESGGEKAKDFIESICPVGSSVVIDEDDNQLDGSYGRVIAKITCNGIILNQSIIENNYGTIDTRFCNSEFSEESWAIECN